jgi:uroporphyrinogen decarboxylase
MATLTSRERVIAAIEFKSADQAPIHHMVFPGAFWRHGQKLVDLLHRYPDDFGNRHFTIPPKPEGEDRFVRYTDEWGSEWLMLKGYTTGEVKKPALDDWRKWPDYRFPPLPPDSYFEALQARIQADGHEWYALGSMGGTLFERMQFLRGTENLFMDLAENREELHQLAGRLVAWHIEWINRYLKADVDGIYFADDWGGQNRLLISPQLWRVFFKPRYRQIFKVVKEAGKHIFFHTDGWTVDIWDDLIELGVDVLNPQHPLIPRPILEQKLAGRVCIRTDLDRQGILPFGTPPQVRAHVKGAVELFGRFKSGLILHGEVGPDVPFENISAMYEAFREFGTYLT